MRLGQPERGLNRSRRLSRASRRFRHITVVVAVTGATYGCSSAISTGGGSNRTASQGGSSAFASVAIGHWRCVTPPTSGVFNVSVGADGTLTLGPAGSTSTSGHWTLDGSGLHLSLVLDPLGPVQIEVSSTLLNTSRWASVGAAPWRLTATGLNEALTGSVRLNLQSPKRAVVTLNSAQSGQPATWTCNKS